MYNTILPRAVYATISFLASLGAGIFTKRFRNLPFRHFRIKKYKSTDCSNSPYSGYTKT